MLSAVVHLFTIWHYGILPTFLLRQDFWDISLTKIICCPTQESAWSSTGWCDSFCVNYGREFWIHEFPIYVNLKNFASFSFVSEEVLPLIIHCSRSIVAVIAIFKLTGWAVFMGVTSKLAIHKNIQNLQQIISWHTTNITWLSPR